MKKKTRKDYFATLKHLTQYFWVSQWTEWVAKEEEIRPVCSPRPCRHLSGSCCGERCLCLAALVAFFPMNLFSCSWVHAKMKTSSIFWQEIPTKAPHLILEQIDHMQETMLLYEHLCCSSVSCRNTFISSNTHSGRPETPPDCPHPFFFHTQLCLLLYMIISLNTD